MTPNSHFYFDYYQWPDADAEPFGIGGCVTIDKVYSFDPMADLTPGQQAHIPVSYTHLDVYKRQELLGGERRDAREFELLALGEGVADLEVARDVYKRQRRSRACRLTCRCASTTSWWRC